jgi:translin
VPALKAILKEIKKDLTQKQQVWEEAQERMRKTTSLSKQSILLSHQKKMKDAQQNLAKAKELIAALRELAKEQPAIMYSGMFSAALQEYAEANIFVTLIKEERFVTPPEIEVPPVDYALGLADVVGELRRLALDSLREGDVKKGEECLQIMDEIYIELEGLDEAYMLVPGLRRKNDVSRRVIEATRGDITSEVRRNSLENYLQRFEEAQKKRHLAQS